jgi:hypothetical protein
MKLLGAGLVYLRGPRPELHLMGPKPPLCSHSGEGCVALVLL